MYDPQGDRPLQQAPNRGGNLQGHTAEPILLWLEAVLNPAGPPKMLGDWPAPPYLDHVVDQGKEGLCFKVPFTGSTQVAKIWEVDHNALCGKLLGHQRRKWADANPPPLFYLWRMGPEQHAPLGVALMPVWTNFTIAYTGTLEDGSVIPGMWNPVGRMPGFPTGCFTREEVPPYVDRWPDGWAPWNHRPTRGAQPMETERAPASQSHAPSGPGQTDQAEQLRFGPRRGQTVQWDVVSGMAWNRPDPADAHEGPLWAAAPGTPGSKWGLHRPPHGRNSDFRLADQTSGFVNRLRDYGRLAAGPEVPGHQVAQDRQHRYEGDLYPRGQTGSPAL